MATAFKRKLSDEVPLMQALEEDSFLNNDDGYESRNRETLQAPDEDGEFEDIGVGFSRRRTVDLAEELREQKQASGVRRFRIRISDFMERRPRFVAGLFILLLSAVTRFLHLAQPPSVCWDETHFGKFANYYIQGKFYFDVHPPLGKMLIGLAGYLSGYKGEHEFKQPGQAFGDSLYYGMRFMCAMFGTLIPWIAFLSMSELDFSMEASLLAAFFLIFDTGVCTLSRYILLDPILMFFIVFSFYCYCRFYNTRRRPFSQAWWQWMALTGVALACAFGTKWVGLFIILFVGMSTAKDLWDLIGDLSLPVRVLWRHFFARVLCLIILPILVYTSFFWIHFKLLPHSGPGDGFMSSAFQTRLKGNSLYEMENPREMAYGSKITVKSYRVSGGLLHSHTDTYPAEVGPPQQQVTTYSHKDSNNEFIIKKENSEPKPSDPVEYIRHGDHVRLEHVSTKRNLHSHNNKAPITTEHYQVTCYGNDGRGDDNDVWRIEMHGQDVKDLKEGQEGPTIKLLTTRFRLVHKNMKCALHSGGVSLPKWGWEQGEVTCNPNIDDPNNLWNLETIVDERLPKSPVKDLSPGFLRSMYELHIVMKNVNNNLKPKQDEVISRPQDWPVLYKGQHFTGWGEKDFRVFLMGNPLIWWGNLVAMVFYVIGFIITAMLSQRGYENALFKRRKQKLLHNGGWVVLCYLFHYIPFYFMSRVLYFHHYYPALIFSCMLTAILLDEIYFWIWYVAHQLGSTKRVVRLMFATTALVLVGSFWFFHPFVYGMTGPVADYKYLKWRETWEV